MEHEKNHISSYFLNGVVLVILLTLTTLTILVTEIHLGPLTVAVALLIASMKGYIVLTYFMHLKYESLFLKLMVGGVFLLFAVVIVITLIDYALR
jgi:cytochrome c oxidase subunit IV